MQEFQPAFGLLCLKGNQATSLCSNFSCSKNSIMCGDEDCKCNSFHFGCPNTTSLTKLKKIFDKKGKSLQPLLYQVYDWLSRQSKLIDIEMKELKKKMESYEMAFTNNENRLYELLINKNLQNLTPRVVAEAMSSLGKQSEHNKVEEKVNKVKKQLDLIQNQFKNMLQQVRWLSKSDISSPSKNKTLPNVLTVPETSPFQRPVTPRSISHKFSKKLASEFLTIKKDKVVTFTEEDSGFQLALIQPNLLTSPQRITKIFLRILNTFSGAIFFGACQLPSNFDLTSPNVHKKINYGSFIGNNITNVFLGKGSGHKLEIHNITRFRTNDVVTIEYDQEIRKITVRNINEGTESITHIIVDKSLPLYFGVMLSSTGEQIEITEDRTLSPRVYS